MLVPMIEALDERGPDSSGIALYADRRPTGVGGTPARCRISLGQRRPVDWDEVAGRAGRAISGPPVAARPFGAGARGRCARGHGDAVGGRSVRKPGRRSACSAPGATLTRAQGHRPARRTPVAATGWRAGTGYLAVAHTRMATESAVTVLHSHPFVPEPRSLRGAQRLVLQLRHRPAPPGGRRASSSTPTTTPRWPPATWPSGWRGGDDLEEATRWVMKEMDGFFTLVISHRRRDVGGPGRLRLQAGGGGRDRRLCRRGVRVPGPGRAARHRRARVFEPQPEEVYTWTPLSCDDLSVPGGQSAACGRCPPGARCRSLTRGAGTTWPSG